MPRQRSTRKTQINLASLVQRARYHPYQMHQNATTGAHTTIGGGVGVAGGIRAIWNKLVQPISILSRLPMRRPVRHSSLTATGYEKQRFEKKKSHSSNNINDENNQKHVTTSKLEISKDQLKPSSGEDNLLALQQPHSTFHDAFNTVILHRNPLFDAEGNTRSGLLLSENIKKEDSINLQEVSAFACQKLSKPKSKKLKKTGSDSDGSSASLESVRTRSDTVSNDSSEKTKSDTEESHSFDEKIESDEPVKVMKQSMTINFGMQREKQMETDAMTSSVEAHQSQLTHGHLMLSTFHTKLQNNAAKTDVNSTVNATNTPITLESVKYEQLP